MALSGSRASATGCFGDQRIGNARVRRRALPVAEELGDKRAHRLGIEVADDRELRVGRAVELGMELLHVSGVTALRASFLVDRRRIARIADRIRIAIAAQRARGDLLRIGARRFERRSRARA